MPTGKIITWIDLRKLNKAIEFSVDFELLVELLAEIKIEIRRKMKWD